MTAEEFVQTIIINVDDAGRIRSRERNDLEFKESYHKKNHAKYAKSLAAFANNRGGYILFGIKDNPREIVGITEDFKNIKQEELTDYLNSMFSPEIEWEMGTAETDGKTVGFLYTNEAIDKPVIAQKSENSEKINSGDVYYRYRARTEKIKFPEMRKIIDEKTDNERERLLRHFETILKSGTTNIGIINYDKGSFSTPMGVDVAIDKKLIVQVLKKAKYIREGSFNETTGQPVLKVTGNISLAEEVPVPDIDPDVQYPYIQKQLAQKLGITPPTVYALIWKYKMRGARKYHLEVTTSINTKTSKFSDLALQFLAEKLNANKDNHDFLAQIREEYRLRK